MGNVVQYLLLHSPDKKIFEPRDIEEYSEEFKK